MTFDVISDMTGCCDVVPEKGDDHDDDREDVGHDQLEGDVETVGHGLSCYDTDTRTNNMR